MLEPCRRSELKTRGQTLRCGRPSLEAYPLLKCWCDVWACPTFGLPHVRLQLMSQGMQKRQLISQGPLRLDSYAARCRDMCTRE